MNATFDEPLTANSIKSYRFGDEPKILRLLGKPRKKTNLFLQRNHLQCHHYCPQHGGWKQYLFLPPFSSIVNGISKGGDFGKTESHSTPKAKFTTHPVHKSCMVHLALGSPLQPLLSQHIGLLVFRWWANIWLSVGWGFNRSLFFKDCGKKPTFSCHPFFCHF